MRVLHRTTGSPQRRRQTFCREETCGYCLIDDLSTGRTSNPARKRPHQRSARKFAHSARIRALKRLQNLIDLGGDLVDRGHAVHRLQLAFGVIIAGQRRGALVIGPQALIEHIGGIILAHRLTGRLGIFCPLDDPSNQGPVINDQFKNGIQTAALLFQDLFNGISLLKCARVPIQDEPARAIGLEIRSETI
jgi:hypothetical protein